MPAEMAVLRHREWMHRVRTLCGTRSESFKVSDVCPMNGATGTGSNRPGTQCSNVSSAKLEFKRSAIGTAAPNCRISARS